MDLLSTIRKSGSRGGVNFSWDEVQTSQHRENYLGHSLMAPVGRWQKGKDLNWYAKGDTDTAGNETAEEKQARERKEEIRKIKEAEEDAIARALGLPVAQRGEATGANNVEVGELKRLIKETEDGDGDIKGMGKGTGFGDFVGNFEAHELLQIKSEEQRRGLQRNHHGDEGHNRTAEVREGRSKDKQRRRHRHRSRSRSRERDGERRHRKHRHRSRSRERDLQRHQRDDSPRRRHRSRSPDMQTRRYRSRSPDRRYRSRKEGEDSKHNEQRESRPRRSRSPEIHSRKDRIPERRR